MRPFIDGHVEPEFGADKQQLRFDVVLNQGVGHLPVRQISAHRLPGQALVAADRHVGREVPHLVVIEGGVDGVLVEDRGLEIADIGSFGHTGHAVNLAPALSPILGHLDQPVVGADIDQPLDQRGLGQRDDVAVVRGRGALVDRVHLPDPPHHGELIPVELSAEVAGDRGPGVAPVIRPEQPLRSEIEPGRRMWGDQERRIPVPTVGRLSRLFLRLDVDDLLRAPVVSHQPAVLPLRVDDVGIGGIDLGLVAIATDGDEPVFV